MPRWVPANRVTFKYGLGDKVISTLRTLHELGLSLDEPGDGPQRGRGTARAVRWPSPRATSWRRACPTRRRWAS